MTPFRLWLAALVLVPTLAASDSSTPARRTLFLSLDAVPFAVIEEWMSHGPHRPLFRGFSDPVPLISTFPSTTSLAFVGLKEPIGIRPSPGYEARFFDREANRLRGGGLLSYGRIEFPWRESFDWKVSGIWNKMMQGLRPLRAGLRDVEPPLLAFRRSRKAAFFAHIGSTDLVGHLKGPAALEPSLRALDEALARLLAGAPEGTLRVVVYSDHGQAGGEPLLNTRKEVLRAAKAAGFRRASRLRGERDLVLAPFGLVSSFVAFTQASAAEEAARALAAARGVDLCAAESEDGWWVADGRGGRARIERRHRPTGEPIWAYRPEHGDPLRLAPILRELREEDSSRFPFFPESLWLEATRDHQYPDPLYRIARGFELVENPASVLCSTEETHLFGAARSFLGSKLSVGPLRWTHGALSREASLGFLITNDPSWQPSGPVRFDQALRPFLDDLR